MRHASGIHTLRGSVLFSFGLSSSIFMFLAYRAHFWAADGLSISPPLKFGLPLSLGLTLAGYFQTRAAGHKLRIEPWGCFTALLILFLSDWLNRSYSLLQGPSIRGEIILFALLGFVLLRKDRSHWFSLMWICTALVLTACFFAASKGRLLISDDHAVFLYRLQSLKQNFPNIPYFEPRWNGGIDARDFFATGSLNFFTVFSPLIYLFPIESIYNLLVALLFFGFCPAMFYIAARMGGLSNLAASLGAVLAMCGNLLWYRWALQYGTMGFITALGLIPLNFVLTSKILSPKQALTRAETILFGVTFTLMLFWSPSGLLFIPAILWGLFKLRTIAAKKHMLSLIAWLIVINVPWIIIFWSVSNVGKFVSQGGPSYTRGYEKTSAAPAENKSEPTVEQISEPPPPSPLNKLSLAKSVQIVRENAVSLNPLIIFACLPGFYLIRRPLSLYLAVTSLWVLFVGAGLAPVNPRLEFERLLVTLVYVLSLPAGACLALLYSRFRDTAHSYFQRLLVCLSAGFLTAGVLSSASVLFNRTLVPYSWAKPEFREMCEALPGFGGEGRVLFTGVVQHELSGGHLAPLVNLCGGSLMASSHVHNVWKYRQLVPKEFMLKLKEGGVEEYFNLFNVRSVLAHEPFWRRYFTERPEKYEKAWDNGTFQLFRRKDYAGDYFLEGKGRELKEEPNNVSFIAESRDLVLKYNYFPFLKSSQCTLSSRTVSPSVTFIDLKDCRTGEKVVISSVSVFKRLWERL